MYPGNVWSAAERPTRHLKVSSVMPPADLKERLRRNPFEPFRIVMSDGTSYVIRSPEFLMVGLGSAVVGLPADEDASLYRVTHQIALRRVLRIEPLEPLASPMSGPAA